MPVSLQGTISFRIRFNTTHGDTDLYWRILIDDTEYLVRSLQCNVPTRSDASFDKNVGVIKYHIAGTCSQFVVDDALHALFS